MSIVAVISISPRRHRVEPYSSLASHLNVETEWMVLFLGNQLRHLRGNLILIWDNLNVHKAMAVKRFLRRHPRLRTEYLPAYAPELNPGEAVWSHMKLNPLASCDPPDADPLADVALRHVSQLRHQPRLLHSFIRQTGLSL